MAEVAGGVTEGAVDPKAQFVFEKILNRLRTDTMFELRVIKHSHPITDVKKEVVDQVLKRTISQRSLAHTHTHTQIHPIIYTHSYIHARTHTHTLRFSL